jgi:rhodanese-related sulfurtransferase
VLDLGAQVQALSIDWHHLPIVDVRPPDDRFEMGWRTAGPGLIRALQAGERVVVHCRGGLGRAGTIAARMLIELGAAPAVAVRRIRTARPGAIETRQQEQYVLGFRCAGVFGWRQNQTPAGCRSAVVHADVLACSRRATQPVDASQRG